MAFCIVLVERDPTKRKVKPAQALFADFEDLGESSDDSDFRIEDHCDESDDDDDSIDSDDRAQGQDSSGDESSSDSVVCLQPEPEKGVTSILSELKTKKQFDPKNALEILICSVCLGDRSDSSNEIIECDNCGVTVHEGCYGVQDSDSVCSTDSPNPTTPWFCDACKAGVESPDCELCPNPGGIFKETDVGKWVHLVCALYMPGVAFGEVDKLSNVTLFEMPYSKWGGKACELCQDQRFARTGVAISCDAGMCRSYFHVTCGQRAGLLTEAHSEEVEQADPFYAHCKLHSDKNLMKKRRRNWLALQMRTEQLLKLIKDHDEVQRVQRRLKKYRNKYHLARTLRPKPWVPTQKMARMLTTSASACRKLWKKAELSGADTDSLQLRHAQVEALSDIHRRWHIQPAFSVEFIAYYLDRNGRLNSMRKQLTELMEENAKLLDEQATIQEKKDQVVKGFTEESDRNKELRAVIGVYHEVTHTLCPVKKLPDLDLMGRPVLHPSHVLASPPRSPLKSGLKRSHESKKVEGLGLNSKCGLCGGSQDQHLLAKCDTCKKHYHLGCLDPPLARMPKKTKLMGWQCSECDKDTDSSAPEDVDTEAPRKLRRRDSANGFDDSSSLTDFRLDLLDASPVASPQALSFSQGSLVEEGVVSSRGGKKRRREKHHRYSPDPSNMRHRHKHKKSSKTNSGGGGGSQGPSPALSSPDTQRQSLKICFKSIPDPTGEGNNQYVATPSISSSDNNPLSLSLSLSSPPSQPALAPSRPARGSLGAETKKKEEVPISCIVCGSLGSAANLVRCDECLNGYHFTCLDPPVKKSPKVRGYSWHCANCDPTESE